MKQKGKTIKIGPAQKTANGNGQLNDTKNIPMMEYSSPRRVLATPMGRKEAIDKGIEICFEAKEKDSDDLGFHVKDAIGKAVHEYWVTEDVFQHTHTRTNRYTVAELPYLLLDGAKVTRQEWGNGVWIEFRKEAKIDKHHDGQPLSLPEEIVMVSLLEDPIKKDVMELVAKSWVPTQGDIFAKDYQTITLPTFAEIKKQKIEMEKRMRKMMMDSQDMVKKQ